MYGQLTLFDKKPFEELHRQKNWIRQCNGRSECFEHPCNGICESLYKCSRRMEYKTLNTYYIEQMDGKRTLVNPVDGCTILCSENKAKADELIRRTKEYFGG